MDAERWRQIDRVLQAALALGGAERRAYLDEVCAGDGELREEVAALLRFEPQAEPFLAEPAIEAAGVETVEAWAVGRVVGPYRVEALLGAGGMGEVYRARDERLGRTVAVKVVLEGGDAALVRRFRQEARMASSLNHPNIVTVYDAGEVDGVPYLVTEYVEGEVLRARMRGGIAVGEAVEVARQVASALGAAHAAGVVHRDIKPENVIVRGDGLVKVVDFGIAKLVEGARNRSLTGTETAPMTGPGVTIGTAAYMSPEQARGEEVDGRTDVWSLGVMLYEMVAGQRPFRGATQMDVLLAVLMHEVERLEGMPEGLAGIIERALRKRAEERYATAGEMTAALEELSEKLRAVELQADERVRTGWGTRAGEAATGQIEILTEKQVIPPTNLPKNLEPLIGRERELRAVVSDLRRARLMTVTGPGGAGKTHLAAAAGRALRFEFEDGVFFVELASIHDPALVVSAIAQALDVKEERGATLDETLARELREREMLLVLDTFEQVIDAAPIVERLLSSAPRLKLLVTSRERLRVSLEHAFPLSPLEVPPSDRLPSSEELAGYGSVALLVERARAVRPGFALTEANAATVAEICRRLDGLPLAIELAAARMKILSPEALLGRLDDRLNLLVGGARDLPERQQTMRAAIAWSYDLLEEAERRLFERLSAFSGGWTLEAAEGLVAHSDVLGLLTRLADKSLVVVEEQGDEKRYRMLETIRQYAAEKLREAGRAAGGE
jgi:predicted ATPase/serine/threonine protein kinase